MRVLPLIRRMGPEKKVERYLIPEPLMRAYRGVKGVW